MAGRSTVKKKKYAQAIANWPLEERPREKLILKGPESLSDAELLAIFPRVGVKGKNAIVLAQELLSRFGSLRGLYAAPVHEIALPIPRDNTRSTQVSDDCKRIIEMRIKLRGDASKLVASIGSIEQNSA